MSSVTSSDQRCEIPSVDPNLRFSPIPLCITMLTVFQAYAIMVGPAQLKVKEWMMIPQLGPTARLFTQAVSCLHLGKFGGRMGHAVLGEYITPQVRVLLGMISMFCACLLPSLCIFTLHDSWIGILFFSYALAGLGLGMFECTFLSVIKPFGMETKQRCLLAIPMAFGMVNVCGMFLTSLGMSIRILYWYVTALLPIGMLKFHQCASRLQQPDIVGFRSGLQQWRIWLPQMMLCFATKI